MKQIKCLKWVLLKMLKELSSIFQKKDKLFYLVQHYLKVFNNLCRDTYVTL